MRRTALYIFLASVVINAALGIYALLAGDFGELEGKILVTSLSVSGASILALATTPAWERRRLWPLPPAGAASSVAGFAFLVAAVWNNFDAEPLWKLALTLLIAGITAVHALLLNLLRLVPRYRWTQLAAYAVAVTLASMLDSAVWGHWNSEWFFRVVGVVAVILAALTVTVPVLHRASRQELAELDSTKAREHPDVSFCPRCGNTVAASAGESVICSGCQARFTVRYEA